jgi:hypothetical protein
MKAIVSSAGEIIALNIPNDMKLPEGTELIEVYECPRCQGAGVIRRAGAVCMADGTAYNDFYPNEEA